MKILIVDDAKVHQVSAFQVLADHDLTVAKSYDEGLRLLMPLGMPYIKKGVPGGQYDVVLSDLLMPACGMMMAEPEKWIGNEQPLGWALVLRAVLNGAKYAALVSDGDHHDHPASFALEGVDNAEDTWNPASFDDEGLPPKKPQFVINGATVGFFYRGPSRLVQDMYGCAWKCNRGKDGKGNPCRACNGTGFARGKDWARVVQCLVGG